ncbi:MAG: hypothetical protein WD341_06040, partial [Tistlia sp.]|uniref:hypothetical protein n=1 Tax=Tistlia sp. TaxID=3057121 RepID=UPI0034A35C77
MPGFRAHMAGAACGGVDPLGHVDRANFVRYAPAETVLVREGVTLVELRAWQGRPGGAVTPPVAACTRARCALPIGTKSPGLEVTLRFSDRGWTGEPDDPDRPNRRYPGLIAESVVVERAGPVLPEAPRRVVTTARIVLANLDGRFDRADRTWTIAGRRMVIKRGPHRPRPRAHWRDFADVAVLRAARWHVSHREAVVELEDTAQRLRVPLTERTYLGTGGGEGRADMAGRRMPFTLGWVAGVKPDLADASNGKYRYADGSLALAIEAGGDRGQLFTVLGDTASEAALDGLTVLQGEIAYCSVEGVLRTGGLVDGAEFRVTVRPAGEGSPGTHAEILEHLWREVAGLDGDEYWPASLKRLPAGPAGWHAPGRG